MVVVVVIDGEVCPKMLGLVVAALDAAFGLKTPVGLVAGCPPKILELVVAVEIWGDKPEA